MAPDRRRLGLFGATGIGVGAIVGGGVLALAGVAFAVTGAGAVAAFALNGFVAVLTVLSFSELASRFPDSGGSYTYARKALTIESAFAVGWVVWFASVVAAVLYALGFAAFFAPLVEGLVRAAGATAPAWIGGRFAMLLYALGAVGAYALLLERSTAGGAQWATAGKVVVFAVLIAGGAAALLTDPPGAGELASRFRPFLPSGARGLFQAMGYTFIALQGFDLIAAVGGEVKRPERTIPRAMLLSLATALVIYLPLLALIVAAGTGGRPIAGLAAEDPEILVAVAARNFLGATGYWLVVVAGVLSMLSALQANLLAASRFARTMAADRTLPRRFERLSGRATPVPAIRLTAATVAFLVVAVPDVAAAGAMASLIFLVSFALVHGIAYLVRKRAHEPSPFRTWAFPAVPAVGGVACLALGLFQALAVPSAGALAALWMAAGAILFVTQLAPGARAVDASSEALDPRILRYRGRRPLVLVPIANPASAETLVTMAHALAPQPVARVMLLSVVRPPESAPASGLPAQIADAQSILAGALSRAFVHEFRPEALITIADDPWTEIARVAERSGCDSLLVGLGHLDRSLMAGPLEGLIARVGADVVILRAPSGWRLEDAGRILVPSGGRRDQSPIRARLLGNLCRAGARDVSFLRVLAEGTDAETSRRAARELRKQAHDEAPGVSRAAVVEGDLVSEVVRHATESDLVIVGLQNLQRRHRLFGERVIAIAQAVETPLVMISQRG